jgi:tetratricopeptide (TPR) repeat protein
MRDLIDRFASEVRSFVEQRDALILLAACTSQDTAIALKTLRDVDRASPADLLLFFADDFTDSASFVNTAVRRFREEHRLACESRVQAGEDSFPPFPTSLLETGRAPAQLLREAMGFARSLLPRSGGHRLVWAMFPSEVANWPAYLQLISSCAPRSQVLPWMRGLRLIFRVDTGFRFNTSPLVDAERIRLTRIDFGPAALEESYRKAASNKQLNGAERMHALLSLAMLDSAHGRFRESDRRFLELLMHYRDTDQPAMQAIVMNGLGESSQRQGDLAKARYWLECAVAPAAKAKEPIVLATVVQSLAAIAFEERRYGEAEGYYDSLAKLKHCILDEDGKALALEWRGLCQETQNAYERAVLSWEEAELLIRVFELHHRLRPLLEHLRRAYQRLQLTKKLAVVEEELRENASVNER